MLHMKATTSLIQTVYTAVDPTILGFGLLSDSQPWFNRITSTYTYTGTMPASLGTFSYSAFNNVPLILYTVSG